MKKVLVMSPHPDDETLGCGGTLRKHVLEGDQVHTIFLTSGERAGHGLPPEETKKIREEEAKKAGSILGISGMEFWRIPNSKLRVTKETVKKLQDKLTEYKPDIIYVTHEGEMHPEHRAAARLVARVLERDGVPCINPEVLMFEVWTPMQDMDYIVDISPFVEIKRKAILAYESQCRVMNFDAALLSLNRYRGEMHKLAGRGLRRNLCNHETAAAQKIEK